MSTSTPKKIKIKFYGVVFQLPSSSLKKTDYHGNPKPASIQIGRVEGASLIKQYVKTKFPNVVVSSKSDSFANGNSINVFVSHKDGSSIDDNQYKQISAFASMLKMGRWNGMEDIYENDNNGMVTDNGTPIETYCKWISTSNKPPFGSPQWVLREISEGWTESDSIKYMSPIQIKAYHNYCIKIKN